MLDSEQMSMQRRSAARLARVQADHAHHTVDDVSTLIGQNIGIERARELVEAAVARLDLSSELSTEDALAVLDDIAQAPGLVGIAARFAKSRAVLRWGGVKQRAAP
jgi:hypothetical protein